MRLPNSKWQSAPGRSCWLLFCATLTLLPCASVTAAMAAVLPDQATRLVTDEVGRSVQVPLRPSRIISLAPSITETLYALGLGDKIVGDTDYCDFPAEAARKPHVGAVQNPSLEKIVSLQPDLVLGSPEANRRELIDQLARLKIPLYGVSDRNLDDVLQSIRDLGRLLDAESQAETLDASLEQRVRAVAERVKGQPKPRVLFVTWYQPLITIGPGTFIADVIRRAGGESISDDLTGDWPRLSLEAVLARHPDVVLLPRSQSYSPSLEDFRKLAGWRDLAAVKDGRVFYVSDAIVRPCPRLVDALEEVARVLHPPPASNGGASRR
jgi:iron complex transport system substrate-binding protein